MSIDISALIAPLSDEAPSGPDLSYDDARIEIESAFERPVSDDGGENDADWRKVTSLIIAQCGQTRDLWLPVYLIRAAAFSKQFDLMVDAAELLAGLLETRWSDVHPQLDEYGFIGRKTPCESLTRIADFLAPLSRVTLIEHPRFGRFSCADIERFADQGASADGYGPFRAVIDVMAETDAVALVDRIDALQTAIRRADGVLTANAEGDTSTNFKPTYEAIDRYCKALRAVLPGQAAVVEAIPVTASADDAAHFADGAGQAAAMPLAAVSAGAGFSGAVRNRDDVVRALDAVCAYFDACEPGSPVPLLLRRAREWTGLDFMAVLEDLAPNSLDEATRVLKSRRTAAADADGGAGQSWEEAPAPSNSGW